MYPSSPAKLAVYGDHRSIVDMVEYVWHGIKLVILGDQYRSVGRAATLISPICPAAT